MKQPIPTKPATPAVPRPIEPLTPDELRQVAGGPVGNPTL